MRDLASTVESLMNEHEGIRGHTRQVLKSLQDLDTLLTTPAVHSRRPEYLDAVDEKRSNLRQAMGYMEDGLKFHHLHEEEVMPALIGDLLMKAIRSEHEEQYVQFTRLNPLLLENDPQRFLDNVTHIKGKIKEICRDASIHSTREDGILYFLKKAR